MGSGNVSGTDQQPDKRTANGERKGGGKSGPESAGSGDAAGGERGGSGGSGIGKPGAGTGASGTAAGTGASAGTGAGTGAGKDAGKTAPDNSSAVKGTPKVKPEDLGGDPDSLARDENGNVILKADGSPAKKRGRKPGQGNSGASNSAGGKASGKSRAQGGSNTRAIEMLAAQFQILNTGIAFLTDFEDFKLDDAEAMQMANATANVLDQFDYVPDPKVAAILGLVTTTGMIYGPRVYLYRAALAKKAQEKRAANTQRADERAATGNENPQPSGVVGIPFSDMAG